jgi:hypothetical protein
LLVLDQLTQALGNVQTHSASSEESEGEQPDHWTQEFFGTDSAWMLKHADDDEGREQPQNNAQDPSNYEYDFPDHGSPPKSGVNRVSFLSAFIGSSVEAAAPSPTCSVLDSYRTELIWLNCRQTESIRR